LLSSCNLDAATAALEHRFAGIGESVQFYQHATAPATNGRAGKIARMAKPPQVSPEEVEFIAVRAQGAGGQNVNKVANAVHLRFVIASSSLPAPVRERLLAMQDQRISKDGVVVIKAQEFRSLEKNRAQGLRRLQELVDRAAHVPRKRRPTRPTASAVARRLEGKAHRSSTKAGRGKVAD
jgi:ribosome-associated protein